jgi:hypothetical protein
MNEAVFLKPAEVKSALTNYYGCCFYLLWLEGYNQSSVTSFLKDIFQSKNLILPPSKNCLISFEKSITKNWNVKGIDLVFLNQKGVSNFISYDLKYYLDIPRLAAASLQSLTPMLKLRIGTSPQQIREAFLKSIYKNNYLESLIKISKQLNDSPGNLVLGLETKDWDILHTVYHATHSFEFYRVSKKSQLRNNTEFSGIKNISHIEKRYKLSSVKIPKGVEDIDLFIPHAQDFINILKKLSSPDAFNIPRNLSRDIAKIIQTKNHLKDLTTHEYWSRLIQIHIKTSA